ncbi:MAG TPA: hypothetical protein VMR86_07885 [Myxococcota bacterium]|nr:hypothetical protein [Myxococcota bacterium]
MSELHRYERLPKLLDGVYRSPSWLDRLFRGRRERQRIAALQELARTAPWVSVCNMLLLLSERGAIADEAARVIDSLMAARTPRELLFIASELRMSLPEIVPESLVGLAETHRETPGVLGLLTLHRSGYVREAAVRELVALGEPRALRYLALRANDWVEAVAERARSGLLALLTPAGRREACRALPFLFPLAERSRRDHRAVIAAAGELLRSDGGRDFVELCGSFDPPERRRGFEWLLAGELPLDAPALRAALAEPDPSLQCFALRALERGVHGPEIRSLFEERADHAPFPRVRAEALRVLAEAGLAGEARLSAALLDPGIPVRVVARAHVRTDLAAFYRAHLAESQPRRLAAAIDGVKLYGTPSDSPSLSALASHPAARVRAAALSALARLAPEVAVTHGLAALGDPSRGLREVARRVLREQRDHLDAAALRTRALELDGPARADSVSLALVLSKWDAVELLLQELRDLEPELQPRVTAPLREWTARFNRSFAQPKPQQRAELRALFGAVAGRLPARTAEFIGRVL